MRRHDDTAEIQKFWGRGVLYSRLEAFVGGFDGHLREVIFVSPSNFHDTQAYHCTTPVVPGRPFVVALTNACITSCQDR